MTKQKNFAKIFVNPLGFACILMISSCAENNDKSEKFKDNVVNVPSQEIGEMDSKRALLVESIIRSSPSLAQTSEIFGEIGSGFNRSYLSDINNVSKYTTLRAQGINLGIYLSDLGYITSYEQSQEIIFYMTCAQKLAEGIGVSDVFDEQTVERMEMNISDKDSIINLISDLYWKTDAFLKELHRENISALIICGGWIEGMHIGRNMIKDNPENTVIYEKVNQQQSNLKKILTLLETFEGDENIKFFKTRLTEINQDFQAMPPAETPDITSDQKIAIIALMEKIEILRNEINAP